MDRRRFHITMIYALWAIIGLAMAATGLVYLLFLPKARKQDEWVEATDLASLQEGIPEEILFPRSRVDGWKVTVEKTKAWLVRKPGNQVVAFAPQCTHLGCAYHWDTKSGNFLCPCHSSRFSIDGNVISGPAPRPLDRYAVKVDSGIIRLSSPSGQV